jgi:alkylhydroperoxidase family enzyme
MLLIALLTVAGLVPPAPFPTLLNADAWAKLPPRVRPPLPEWVKLPPEDRPLPEWARMLAGPLPKTTAKMLELDYFHREKNPLGKVLAAEIRLVVAVTLRSEAGFQAATADLRREGFTISDLGKLMPGADAGLPEAERTVLAFARKLTAEGHAITDKEFANLLELYGPEKVTAIVHTVAYANFHNRLLLGLGVKGESPPAPPVPLKFDLDAAKVAAPARPPWDDLKAVKAGGLSVRVEWGNADAEDLARKLEKQKDRTLRIPLPDKTAYDKLPPKEKESAQRILWNTVSAGYQPEMNRAWFACLYAFYEESKPDRVFTNSAFWVVTRTNDCFY